MKLIKISVILILPFVFSGCYLLHLSKNVIAVKKELEGIWVDEDNNQYEIVKKDKYMFHIFGMDGDVDRNAPDLKMTFHKIKNHKFVSIIDSEGGGYTLSASKISSKHLVFKEFHFRGDEVDFDEIPDTYAETVFNSLVSEKGISIDTDTYEYKKLYGRP